MFAVGRTSTALGPGYRRPAARIGKAKAITATARKLAVLVYRVLSGKLIYNDPGAAAYHELNRARELNSLRKRAKLLGLDLIDRATGQIFKSASDAVVPNPVTPENNSLARFWRGDPTLISAVGPFMGVSNHKEDRRFESTPLQQ